MKKAPPGPAHRKIRPSILATSAAALLSASLFLGSAQAATQYWDTNGATAGFGGTGNWNLVTDANWNDATGTGAPAFWTNGNDAVFQGTAGTVSVNVAGVTVHNLTFNTGPYTIQGPNNLTLTTGSTITLGAGTTTDLTVSLADSGGGFTVVSADGTATPVLKLDNSNTFTGPVNVNSGTVTLTALSPNTGITGSALNIGDGVGAAGTAVVQNVGFGDNIADTTVVTIKSDGVYDLNTFGEIVGGVSLQGGSIIGGTSTLLQSGTAFDMQSGSSAVNLGGAVALNKTTAGTVTLTGVSTYTGGTSVTGGILAINSDAALGATTGGVSLNGGTLQANANLATTRTITLGAGGGTITTSGPTILNLDGKITGVGALNLSSPNGAAAIFLDGTVDNDFTGLTTVLQGFVELNAVGHIALPGNVQINSLGILSINTNEQIADTATVTNNGSFTFFGAANVTETIGTLNGTGIVYNSANNLGTLIVSAGTFTGHILDNNGVATGTVALVKQGAGTFTLSGTNTYSAGTTISGGILAISNDVNLGATSGGVTFNNNATLQTTAGVTFAAARTFTINATGGTIDTDGQTSTLNGAISGAGILSVTDSTASGGKLTLTHDNSGLTGGLAVNEATVAVSADNNLGAAAAPLSISNNGQVEFTGSFSTARPISFPTGIGSLNVDSTITTTLTGVLSGAGTVQKLGAGSLVVTQNNPTLTGAVILSNGSLYSDVTAGGPTNQAFGTGRLNVRGSGVTLGSHVSGEFIPNITNVQASFFVAPTGTLTFSGPVSLSGGPTISLVGGAVNGVIFTGAISGSGGVTLATDAATVADSFIFGGTSANTYSGLTTVAANTTLTLRKPAGVSAIGGDLTIQPGGIVFLSVVAPGGDEQIPDTATVTVNSTGNATNAPLGWAGLNLQGHTETIGTLLGNGTVRLDGSLGGGVLKVGAGNFSGVISDTGAGGQLVKVGTGTLILSGQNTYIGNTTIDGGLLQVDGSIASANTFVNPLATLGGTGFLGGNVINAGFVSPGDSPGTLSIKGNYTQKSNGTLVIQIAGSGAAQHDLLAVQGNASLAGNLQLIKSGKGSAFKVGQKIIFLTAAGGVSGTFSTIQSDFSTGSLVLGKVVYEPNDVLLEGVQGPFSIIPGLTPNQKAVVANLDHVLTDPRATKLLAYLDNEPLHRLPHDFDLIAPEELTSIFTLGVALEKVQADNIQRRNDDIRSGTSGFSAAGLAINGRSASYSGGFQFGAGVAGPSGDEGKEVKETKAMTPVEENRWGAFLSGTGEWVNVSGTDNARGYNLDSGDFTLGIDYKVTPNLAIGLMAGYTGSSADLTDHGRIYVNGGNLGIYATFFQNEQAVAAPTMSKDSSKEVPSAPAPSIAKGFYADIAATGGYNSYDTRRSALQGEARGDTDGGEINALFGMGYDFKVGGLTFGPTGSFNYTYVGTNDYNEHGSLAPLDIHGGKGESLRTAFGFKASYDWKVGGVLIKPEIRAAWQHEYGDVAYALDSAFANGAGGTFTVNGPELGRDSALLGAGFAIQFNERMSTYFYYDGELGRKNYQSTSVTGGVRVAF